MTVQIVTPAPSGSRAGNRVTARRWAGLLRALGHRVRIETEYRGGRPDVLVALHAAKSHPSVRRFRERWPRAPLVVALTGTDVYLAIPRGHAAAHESLALADRLVVLQPLAIRALPEPERPKARVIRQSAPASRPAPRGFEICVIGHLRPVKDPFRAALASRHLPPDSRLRLCHLGAALDDGMAARARAEERRNPRYRWLGERPRAETLWRLARARALVLSSRAEGGANVISEAIAAGTPVLASRIDGSVGLLGADHPGYFPVGDTAALARLLDRIDRDERFHRALAARSRRLAPLVRPEREAAAWRRLLEEL